jgi:predicted RNA-binding Zn-ribbon protein involved in translation (DUF1610 family)
MKTTEEVVNLIMVVQDPMASELKKKWAMNDLLADIIKYRMERFVAQYIRDVTVSGLDASDIRQAFLIGCSDAIPQADVNVGDAMMFIIQKGKWAAVDLLRKHYRADLRQYCHSCSRETHLNEKGGRVICPKCGASGDGVVERITQNNLDDGTVLNMVAYGGNLQNKVVSRMFVEEFRQRLTGRKRDVFDLVVVKGFDRESSTNYMRECAEILGVSQQNINIRMKQIKEDWLAYTSEQDDDMPITH